MLTIREAARFDWFPDAGGKGQFEDAKRAPTVRELITHTAGFVYEIWDANAQQAVSAGLTESFLAGATVRKSTSVPTWNPVGVWNQYRLARHSD